MAPEGLRGRNARVSKGKWSFGRDLTEDAVGHLPDALTGDGGWRAWPGA
jgi:hypothetical protein